MHDNDEVSLQALRSSLFVECDLDLPVLDQARESKYSTFLLLLLTQLVDV